MTEPSPTEPSLLERRDVQIGVVERWGLLAGVTGIAANLLLIALYALGLPDIGDYDWTGPANDVMGGIVSTSATIPVALALGELVGGGLLVRWATRLAVAAMAALVVSTVLLVTDAVSFEIQVFVAAPAVILMLGWTAVVGRAGKANGLLPPRLARAAVVIGVAACVGTVLVGAGLLLPPESASQYAVAGAGLLAGVPAFLAFPVWLILLANRLRAHLTHAHAQAWAHSHQPMLSRRTR